MINLSAKILEVDFNLSPDETEGRCDVPEAAY